MFFNSIEEVRSLRKEIIRLLSKRMFLTQSKKEIGYEKL